MILTSVVLTFVTLAAASQVQPPAPAGSDAVRVHTIVRPDGRLQIWEISQGRLAPLPRPAAGALPLTGAQATTIAQSWLSRQIPGIKEWTRTSITLRRFGTDGGGAPAPNGWFYALLFEPANRQPVPPPFASDSSRFWTVVLLDGTVVEPKVVDDPNAAAPISGAPAQADPTVYTVGPGTDVIPPRVIFSPQPRYSPEAMRAQVQGNLKLRCVVNTQGVCEDVRVTESLDTVHGLDEGAIRSVQQWRFNPGTLNGKPVKVAIVIELSFNLRDPK